MHYDRKIKYWELMEDGVSLHNAGFVKLENRDGHVNIQIKVEKLKALDSGVLQVLLVSDEKKNVLGELSLEEGKGSMLCEGLDHRNLAEGLAYEDLQELQIRLQGNRLLRCVVKESKVKQISMVEPEEETVKEELPEIKDVQEVEEQPIMKELPDLEAVAKPTQQPELGGMLLVSQPEDVERSDSPLALQMPREEYRGREEEVQTVLPTRTLASTKWQQLLDMYPHIKPFHDHREYLQLKPEDLVVLSSECYPLVSNSFLLHGFYNYKHLILTKAVVRGQEQYYIGAPGNFYVKEKQVAVLFGFESFEGKAEPAQNGDFGYYMIPVEI